MTADRVEVRGSQAGQDGRQRDRIIGVTPFGRPAARLAVAVARAGGLAVLDLGRDRAAALSALEQVGRWWSGPFAVRLSAGCPVRPEELPEAVGTILVDAPGLGAAQPYARGRRVLVEVVDPAEAHPAVQLGADGLIARGCEAGGRVGELTTFVLLQHLVSDSRLGVPVWAAGGIGPHTAAAALTGGAEGVVLDAQLALAREMDLPADVAAALAAMDGSETRLINGHRVYTRPDLPAFDTDDTAATVRRLGAMDLRTQLLPVGQDGAFAGPLAGRHKTAGGIVQAVRHQIAEHISAALRAEPLAPREVPGGRDYPVLQGPMTRVSDRAAFAAAIAQDGGLPFLALALMTGDEARRLLTETAERLGDRQWGVGILGFAPPEVREAQLAAVHEIKPPYALIAGGRPSQAAPLEEAGITTYLHVPSPGLLDRFLAEGARRFVFEGMECGGHVGPRASFPLWEAQMERLLGYAEEHPGAAAEISVAFAGGIHDERSAAMVAALAGPLADQGAEIRVLMGTSYLFTYEAVAAGAILPGFQRAAVECDGTVLLETSPGHATRCARSPYVDAFADARRDLEASGASRQEMWAKLEDLNLGRLRIASKGLRREGGHLAMVGDDEQRREGMYMIGQVAALRSSTTSIVGLHEQISAGATRFLAARAASLGLAHEPAADTAGPVDIAIVGIGCVFPQARDADEYWANIVGGVNAITEVPAERWDPETYWDPDSTSGDKTPSKWGGFLPDVPFDALAYGIPPNSLSSVEPMQLLALEVAARALKDAGYADRPFDRSRTSVFFGAEAGTDLGTAYSTRALLPKFFGEVPPGLDEQLPRLTEDSFPGVLTNVVAGRIANRLNLGGSNYTVDAACAASLAALDAACKELTAKTSDMVLCGGADLHNGIYDYLLFASVHALSPSGRCATFDAGADGIALGEGVACVALKRLADAERDGDRVYAVIKSVAGSSDGRSLGLTAPRVEGQRLALERAYGRAGVSPADVGLIEAHGTGTAVGDRTELTTLTETFAAAGAEPGSVVLGSVKSQIGHTKCAAGLAGLIKTAYALHTGVRPGTLHVSKPTGAWDPAVSPFAFDQAARPWATAPGERYAGVSGFGFGGANFHAVLAGYDGAPEPVSGLAEWPAELFLIRGADRAAARAELDRLGELLSKGPRLRDLARTFAVGEGPVHIALVATDPADLEGKLAAAREFEAAPGVFVADEAIERGKVAFLYPGQGSQRPGMLGDLFVAFPRLQRLLRLAGGRYADAMFPPAAFTPRDKERQREAITDTRVAQPTLGIAGLAMHRLLTELGVRPDMAGGHSYGELVALCAAGVFGDGDLVELSAIRAEAILRAAEESGASDPGAMAAVAGTLEEVRAALDGISDLVVANHNAPRQVVISGVTAAVDAAVEKLAAGGLPASRIPVACAFHSPLVGGAAALLRAELAERDLRSPAFPVWSNTTAAPYDTEPGRLAGMLAGQVAAPVRFVDQIESMYAAGARVFVEAGPGRVLSRLVGKILGDRPHTVVACEQPARGGLKGLHGLLLALAELAAAGVEVDPLPLFAGRDAVAVSARTAPARPGWIVNGHLVRTADGGYLTNALRPAQRVALPTGGNMGAGDRDAAVLEYLRTARELIAAQRDVVLGYLGTAAPASMQVSVPAEVPSAPVPAPRAVVTGEVVPAPAPAADAAPAPRALGEPDIRAAVLAVIGVRTGYPEEMLGADLDLEADLSIDSIKRTEIIAELADRVGLTAEGARLDESIVEQLARIKTIGEIVTWVCGHLGVDATAGDAKEAEALPETATAGAATAGAATAGAATAGAGDGGPRVTAAAGETQPIPAVHTATATLTRTETATQAAAQTAARTANGAPQAANGAPQAANGAPQAANGAPQAANGAPQQAAHGAPPPANGAQQPAHGAAQQPARVARPAANNGAPQQAAHGAPPAANGAAQQPARGARPAANGGPQQRAETAQAAPHPRPAVAPPRRHVVRMSELPPLPEPRPMPGRLTGQRFAIIDDGCGVALELADLLEQQGAQVRTPLEADGPADALIQLAALRPGSTPVLPGMYGGVREALLAGARRLVFATGSGGTFGHRFDGSGVGDPSPGAGLRGLARTLAQEFPNVLVRAVDVDIKDAPRAIALRILAELLDEPGTARGPVEVGYEGPVRRTLTVTPQELTAEAPLRLGRDGVVLLTGGARGITARVAQTLAATTGCHIELIGRTPVPGRTEDPALAGAVDAMALRRLLVAQGGRAPAEIEGAIRRILAEREMRGALTAMGGAAASVRYHALDVRDPQAVRAVVEDIYRRFGRLDGVIHGAGLLEDRLVRDKDPESFARVYRTKVDGAQALATAVRPDLGFFVVFGSVSGVYGNRGQADYAAANDACDTLARVWRTELRGRVLVADWGPWAGGGMVSPELAREYARRGIALIDPEAGVAALLREIAAGNETQVVFTGVTE